MSAVSISSSEQSRRLQRPIFIFGPHKSGSSLLRNLFDGHSQLQVIPVETHFFRLMSYWVDYNYLQQRPAKVSTEVIRERLKDQVHHFNVRDNKLGDSDLKGRFDEEIFHQQIDSLEEGSEPDQVIVRYLQALYQSIAGEVLSSHRRVVQKTVGMAEFALDLKKLFPDASFVHIIRNPYANLVSYRKFYASNGPYPLLNRMIGSLGNNYYHMMRNQRLIDNYQVIRYEDLIADPEQVMRNLSGALGLPFEKVLLQPTQLGETWAGNSTSQKAMSGISAKPSDRWKQEIFPLEAKLINQSFPFILDQYDYESFSSSGSWLKPVSGEGIKRYLFNRLFMAYNRSYSQY